MHGTTAHTCEPTQSSDSGVTSKQGSGRPTGLGKWAWEDYNTRDFAVKGSHGHGTWMQTCTEPARRKASRAVQPLPKPIESSLWCEFIVTKNEWEGFEIIRPEAMEHRDGGAEISAWA
ncbi:hypothetical protein CEXT_362971 [Caerostris extrusa]|uniref:Uncharacterized protein n=1 Tax=Caerostris extrusa TaxID=172846 RepID=A0AAV4X329_CAEEX|nr:hypothetical protein CEXT_362971 [Caerostris extrusa]